MKNVLIISSLVAFLLSGNGSNAQQIGPKKPASFDIKLLKSKVLYLPVIDKVPPALQSDGSFKGFDTDKKIDAEYARRWEEALSLSSYDFTPAEVAKINVEKLKKEKDKVALCLLFEKDFYDNYYVYIAMMEPKYEIIASTIANGLDLTKVQDMKLLLNMLTYSLVKAGSYYGDDARPLFRDHEYRYGKNLDLFTDTIKSKLFLVPKFDKALKNSQELNTKLKDFLRANWKISTYDMLEQSEIDARLNSGTFNGFYLKSVDVNSSNPKLAYKYYLVLTSKSQDVIFDQLLTGNISPGNFKFMQTQLQAWLVNFMPPKERTVFLMNQSQPVTPAVPQKK